MAEHELRMLENKALRRLYGPKEQKVAGCWSELHNEELQNVLSSAERAIIRMSK
jgi:hypothetical protein